MVSFRAKKKKIRQEQLIPSKILPSISFSKSNLETNPR